MSSQRSQFARNATSIQFEALERRQLMASSVGAGNALIEPSAMLVASALQPSVIGTRPGAGATDVLRDSAIAADCSG